MRGPWGHKIIIEAKMGILVIGIVMMYAEVFAKGDLSGRYELTYNNSSSAAFSAETFLQRYEATLRDQFFKTNNLKVTLFFDDGKNLTSDLTLRRYRGDIRLTHPYYAFSVRVTPRQKTTPLEMEQSRELTENRITLDLRFPKAPRLRLVHDRRSNYEQGVFTGRTRDIRGDLTYRYQYLQMALKHWYSKSENDITRKTTVTGANLQLRKTLWQWLGTQAGYDHLLTRSTRAAAHARSVLNQVLTTSLHARYRDLLAGSMSLSARRSTTKNEVRTRLRDETIHARLTAFPDYHVYVELLRNYTRSKQPEENRLSDYATLQAVATLPPLKRFAGRAHVARRFEIRRENTGPPTNLYYLSLTANVYRGIDAQGQLNVTERREHTIEQPRFLSLSRLEVFLKPRSNVRLSSYLRYDNTSERFTLLKNERVSYGGTLAYRPRPRISLGTEIRRSEETTGRQREDTAVSFNAALALRNRATVTVSYGVNDADALAAPQVGLPTLDSHSTSLNAQALIWVTGRGRFTVNYSDVDRENGSDSDFIGVSYRQDL